MPKIAFSDIDGTLLNADREPSPALKTEVARLSLVGVPFILISSRMPQAMTWIQEDLGINDLPLICYNGGLVLVDGDVIHSSFIPPGIISHEFGMLNARLKLSMQLFHGDEWYVESMDHYALREQNNTRVTPVVKEMSEVVHDWSRRKIGAHKIMVMGDPEGIDKLVAALQTSVAGKLHLYRSKADYLEVASSDISKLTGVEMLLAHKYPGITLADCVAFGDNYNDIEMLKGVGTGVAVANAKPEVLAVADAVTGPAKEDGVALALQRLFTAP